MPNDDDSYAGLQLAVDNRVRKDTQRKGPTLACGGCAEARVLDQERSDTLDLAEKAPGYERPRLLGVEVQGISDVPFGVGG